MARFSQPRSAFGLEALARLKPIFDDVWKELISEGVFELPSFDEGSTRTRLAYKVLTFASTDWSEIQMKQLLLRAFRNEVRAFRELRVWGLGPPPFSRMTAMGAHRTWMLAKELRWRCCQDAIPVVVSG